MHRPGNYEPDLLVKSRFCYKDLGQALGDTFTIKCTLYILMKIDANNEVLVQSKTLRRCKIAKCAAFRVVTRIMARVPQIPGAPYNVLLC